MVFKMMMKLKNHLDCVVLANMKKKGCGSDRSAKRVSILIKNKLNTQITHYEALN